MTDSARPSWNDYFMDIAFTVAQRSTCDRAHVGAVIVRARRMLTTGYNGAPAGLAHCDEVGHLLVDGHCVRTLHAEQNAIIQAALHGVPINSLSIELQGDYDMRGNLGIDKTIPRSFLCMRYIVTIDSPAPRAAVEQVIDRSDDLDWVRDVFARAIPMEREIKLTHSRAAE